MTRLNRETLKRLQEEGRIPIVEEDRKSKYSSEKTVVDGISFHSRKEGNRYCELKILERSGYIKGLQLQVKFEIHGRIVTEEGVKLNKRSYIADFVYRDVKSGRMVIEDTKGYATRTFKNKWREMQERYGREYEFIVT